MDILPKTPLAQLTINPEATTHQSLSPLTVNFSATGEFAVEAYVLKSKLPRGALDLRSARPGVLPYEAVRET